MRHSEPRDTSVVDASHGFELRDIALSVIVKWVLALFAFMAFSAVLAYGTYLIFIPRKTILATDTPMRPERMVPPKPQLQAYPKSEMRDFRADEDAKINGYGWADKDKTAAKIPVEDAIKQLAQGGLPTQPTSATTTGTGYDPTGQGRNWPAPQPVGTENGYKPPVVYRKYPY